jgi:hypothetical protein
MLSLSGKPCFDLIHCSRKQSSLWLEGEYFRQKLRGQENGPHRTAFSKLLLGVDDISINEVENQDKEAAEPVMEPSPWCCLCSLRCC